MHLLEEYNSIDDSELCKALSNLNELLQRDTSIIIFDSLSQYLQKIICKRELPYCIVVNAFKLFLKEIDIRSHTSISTHFSEREEIFKDYWEYVKEKIANLLQKNGNLLKTSQLEELIDLTMEAINCNVDKDGYETLLNCFMISSMPIKKLLLEKIQLMNLDKDILQSNFVLPLFEKIFVVIQELIHEQGFEELFLFNLSSDGGTISNDATLHTCFSFMIDMLLKTRDPQYLVEGKLAFIVNGLIKYLRESYSGSNELLMNTFAEWMAHLIDTIFERLKLENWIITNNSEDVQEMIIRVALSPLPLTATELNIRAFHSWLLLLFEPNKISQRLLSLQITDMSTGVSLNIFVAAFDIACNDIDQRVRTAAFKVVIQALLLNYFEGPLEMDNITKPSVESRTCRNDLMDDIISTTVGWPTSADEQAAIYSCLALGVALIYRKDFREVITHYFCQPRKEAFFDRLLDFLKNMLVEEVPESITQHLLYLVSVCLTFSDASRQILTNRIDFLNAILSLAISQSSSLTRGLSYVVISFFLGSGCHDSTLSEYETKLRSCKLQFRQDLMFCLDNRKVSSSPIARFEGLLRGSPLSDCLDVIKEHWSHLFRNALITLETVPFQFSKFSEIVSASECSFGNSSLTRTISSNPQDLYFTDMKLSEPLLPPFSIEDEISIVKKNSSVMESSNADYSFHITSSIDKDYPEEQQELSTSEEANFSAHHDSAIAIVVEDNPTESREADIKAGLYEKQSNLSSCLQNETANMEWIDKLDRIYARLESIANFIEGTSIETKEKAKICNLGNQRKTNRLSQWQQESFEIFSVQDGDINRCKAAWIDPNEDIRKIIVEIEDHFSSWQDEMEEWHQSSIKKLQSHFQQIFDLENSIVKVKECLAVSHFHEDELLPQYDKEEAQLLHDIYKSPTTFFSDFDPVGEKKKLQDQQQLAHSLVVRLKTSVYGEFNRWCNYLRDEVFSRLSENSDILSHLQMQIYTIKHTCVESNQLGTLLTLLFRRKNRRGDLNSTTEWEDVDFLKGDELSFLMDKLSGQRPLVALISLCIFLRDYLDLTRRDLSESNSYLERLQGGNKSNKSKDYKDLAEDRIKDLVLQKEKLYSLLDDLSKRWQESLGREFPVDDFHLAANNDSIPMNNKGSIIATHSLSDEDNSQLEEKKSIYSSRKHEKLLLHALKVNNTRIEKIAKISMQNGGSRHSVGANPSVALSDYKRLQNEHKILLAVLAELHREYCKLANQSIQTDHMRYKING
ncbi:uncharacterized protein Gasu_50920 [Galdieria sulphuraria]|uniref:Uncharacterized protein n=1 Tax=Galdieria sulphuraria TaxID=130081 RepID=M2XUR0_GALSU|nr:uncharacterized protein Gasu_50920 [Galdieria sulphuraria]EME27363.1 hypothetical protein Gasu_50920 [Galdieria sulphuraria]|eukprot:XP_005703883.1 hypothetical protein Gasu_50920 [Galdieria sulphuraria]